MARVIVAADAGLLDVASLAGTVVAALHQWGDGKSAVIAREHKRRLAERRDIARRTARPGN
jgi:hypothetical protein